MLHVWGDPTRLDPEHLTAPRLRTVQGYPTADQTSEGFWKVLKSSYGSTSSEGSSTTA